MKWYVLVLAFFLFPTIVWANGAWERYVDRVLVELSASPLSPLEGEQVGFILSFRDPAARTYLTDIVSTRVQIHAFEVPSYPQGGVVFKSEPLLFTEGSAEFNYRFTENGIYDIHALYHTPDGKEHDAGFLTSVRAPQKPTPKPILPVLAAVGIAAFWAGWMLARRKYSMVK